MDVNVLPSINKGSLLYFTLLYFTLLYFTFKKNKMKDQHHSIFLF